MSQTELGPAPTTENVEDLGLEDEFTRLEELLRELVDGAAANDEISDDAMGELLLAHVSVRPFANGVKARQCDFLAGFIRERVADCDGHLFDAEAVIGGWDETIRDARQLCWGIAEALPSGIKEGRGRVSRCARCFEININATPNTLPCPECARRGRERGLR